MIDLARQLLDSFDDEQRPIATAAFDDEQVRRDWHYVPRDHPGLAMAAMTHEQRRLVHDLVADALAIEAYAKVATIMALDDVLNRIEGGGLRQWRDSDAYRIQLFGTPGPGDEPWGWRFEGHHVSINVTLVGDETASTPLFLGANPAHIRHDGRTVVRPLAEEEDVARALLHALSPDQRRAAVIADEAPDDILTGAAPTIERVADEGVGLGALNGEAAELADALVRLYVERVASPPSPPDRNQIRFAWAGPPEEGAPHYYRLTGERFLVELDNTQDGANHVHTVWRDPEGDFGDDLLRRHVAVHHQGRFAPDSTPR